MSLFRCCVAEVTRVETLKRAVGEPVESMLTVSPRGCKEAVSQQKAALNNGKYKKMGDKALVPQLATRSLFMDSRY